MEKPKLSQLADSAFGFDSCVVDLLNIADISGPMT